MKKIFYFYINGFKNLKLGRTLWIIILIKLFIMFGIFRPFLFDQTLKKRFKTEEQIQEYVLDELTNNRL